MRAAVAVCDNIWQRIYTTPAASSTTSTLPHQRKLQLRDSLGAVRDTLVDVRSQFEALQRRNEDLAAMLAKERTGNDQTAARAAKAEAEQHRACDLLIEYLETQYDHVLLVHTPAIGDMRPFTWRDWDARLRYTYQLDLADTKILWDKIERRTRTVIRKAEKLGYTLQSTDDVALFRRLYETLYNQQSGGAPIAAATTERQRVLQSIDSAISGLGQIMQQELRQFLDLLNTPVLGRLLGRPDVGDPVGFLKDLRTSSLALKRSAYTGLRDLYLFAWYGLPRSWAAIGYSGPPDLPRPGDKK